MATRKNIGMAEVVEMARTISMTMEPLNQLIVWHWHYEQAMAKHGKVGNDSFAQMYEGSIMAKDGKGELNLMLFPQSDLNAANLSEINLRKTCVDGNDLKSDGQQQQDAAEASKKLIDEKLKAKQYLTFTRNDILKIIEIIGEDLYQKIGKRQLSLPVYLDQSSNQEVGLKLAVYLLDNNLK